MTGERITREDVEARLVNLNRRLESRGSAYFWAVQGRYGYIGLDRYRRSDGAMMSTITAGTKREIADFLRAAMVALDDAAVQS
jgi:hypothetical protein